ncbi:hypothetical protein M407DRAFT_13071, partial [Tulasnella calospora MUT 4182]
MSHCLWSQGEGARLNPAQPRFTAILCGIRKDRAELIPKPPSSHPTPIPSINVLSPLKPLGSILVTICDHVVALEGNKEAAIVLAERVNRAVQVLVNRARDLDGAMPGSYLDDIKNLENVLIKIATSLQKSLRRKWFHRVFSPKADASELNALSSDLEYAMRIFGLTVTQLSTNFEARQTFQTVQAFISKEANRSESSELSCP